MKKISTTQFTIAIILSLISLVIDFCAAFAKAFYPDIESTALGVIMLMCGFITFGTTLAAYIICGLGKVIRYSWFRFNLYTSAINTDTINQAIYQEAAKNGGYIKSDRVGSMFLHAGFLKLLFPLLWIACFIKFSFLILLAARSGQKKMEQYGLLQE